MTYGEVFGKIKRTIEKERKNFFGKRDRYDLSFSELCALYEATRKEPYEGLCCAFDYGFIKGMRYYKKHGGKRG